jgi:hypothetical protein
MTDVGARSRELKSSLVEARDVDCQSVNGGRHRFVAVKVQTIPANDPDPFIFLGDSSTELYRTLVAPL